jgi:hypothetical protein
MSMHLRAFFISLTLCGCVVDFPAPPGGDGDASDALTGPDDGGRGVGAADARRAVGGTDKDADPDAPDADDAGTEDAGDAEVLLDVSPGCVPTPERCNSLDDDCDGRVDEDFDLGGVCNVGVGACFRSGVRVCDGLDGWTCSVEPGAASQERCNERDDDCDGETDEDFALGGPCARGEGACLRAGVVVCDAEGELSTCDAAPGEPAAERCNGFDDDCDGEIDEDWALGDACSTGLGRCAAEGVIACDAEGAGSCNAQGVAPRAERCDGADDDCDGETDEDFRLGEACTAGLGVCARDGLRVCDDAGSAVCDAAPGPAGVETCNGLDDDCDGLVDPAPTCGAFLASRCRVWLGQADNGNLNVAVSDSFGDCPGESSDGWGSVRCTSTRGDERFRSLDLSGDVNDDDRLGVAFTCGDAGAPALAAYIQTHCAVYLGHADNNAGPADDAAWGPCPNGLNGELAGLRCTSSGYDGRFRPMALVGDVDENDDLAIAFVCRDAADPERARAMAASAEVILAWARNLPSASDGGAGWGDCPGQARDNGGDARCVSSAFDQLFHKIDLDGDVDTFDKLGVSLRARR